MVQKVPHKITPNDVAAIHDLMEIMGFQSLAQTLGIKYTTPKLPNCTDYLGLRGHSLPPPNVKAPPRVYHHVDTFTSGLPADAAAALIATAVTAAKALNTSLPATTPGDFGGLVSNVVPSGTHGVASTVASQVPTVLKTWQVANNWPVDVNNRFTAIVDGASTETFTAFALNYTSVGAEGRDSWMEVTGVARNWNGSVIMAYTTAGASGTAVTQYSGNEKKVDCGFQREEGYAGFPTCYPPSCQISSQPFPLTCGWSAGCGDIVAGVSITGSCDECWSPGTCSVGSDNSCQRTACRVSRRYLDFTAMCGAKKQECLLPLTQQQVLDITAGLQSTSHPQIMAQVNLLAIQVGVTPPFPA